ncbi:MAG: MurR/RpiR family transcriptional regulator [Schleiferilactobacillus harbinensis]|jgi:DNA-binding MurR/RpiR family transcriptional regulator|uniref:HTH rpiR-type domain-containing protein n=1 Tax=Schleiferilactobacillus perolens DSM 12744 TaxID=1423792 RepID=A0A0R1NBW5_9LACO|nr:MurR/RpiR family transcriptional regulator [Schleiferilactobacillus perolens]KRL14483.1 hypothetical protein FD09_GL000131 [Schleiferilactobacillus perolens DSM 12744]MCI1890802.1 MurR/RpiR family transcriptional regulator [Schleiferilactobacillus harbinensis]MCI1911446.1 MurR/RpiR family transcriptional regulator [Schleiferilactobacillus harbinensis]
MGLLIVRLLTLLNTEDSHSTVFHVAETLVEHYDQIADLSIGDMAMLANVSKSTMSKFARKIGFDDYYDLKDSAPFVEDRFNNRLNYLTNIVDTLEKNELDEYFSAIQEDIDTLRQSIDKAAIDRLAQALVRYHKVAAFGLLFSESAALDFQYKLAYNGKFIFTCQEDLKQEQYVREAGEDTLIIVFTNSGNYVQQNQLLPGWPKKNSFRHSRAHIFAVTANPELAKLSYIEDTIVFPHRTSIQTHAFLYQIIMDLIVARYRHFALKNGN